MDLKGFEIVTPDVLFESCDNSITFLYVGETEQLYWDRNKSHKDMFLENPYILEDILGDWEVDLGVEKLLVNKHTDGIVIGVMGVYNKTPVIAFWNSLKDKKLDNFFNSLIFQFPVLESLVNSFVVIGSNHRPKLLSSIFRFKFTPKVK